MRLENGLRLSVITLGLACSSKDPPPAIASGGGSGGLASVSGGASSAGAPSESKAGSGGTTPSAGTAQSGAASMVGGGQSAAGAAGAPSGGSAGGSAGSGPAPAQGGTGGGASGGGESAGAAGAKGGTPNPGAVIVSDDFDQATASGPPDPNKWEGYEEWASSFAPTVDSSRFHSAPNSVRVTSTNTGQGSFLVPKSGLPVEGNSFYVRVYINWEKPTSAIMGHSGFLVGATARDNSGTELRLGLSNKGPGDQAMLDLNLIGGSGGEVTRYSNGFTDGGDPGKASGNGYQFSADTWVCLEAFFNGGAHEFRVWADGAELEAMHVQDFQGSPGGTPRTMWAPSYSVLKIGAQDYDANLGKIWYDDVVVSKERVGCE